MEISDQLALWICSFLNKFSRAVTGASLIICPKPQTVDDLAYFSRALEGDSMLTSPNSFLQLAPLPEQNPTLHQCYPSPSCYNKDPLLWLTSLNLIHPEVIIQSSYLVQKSEVEGIRQSSQCNGCRCVPRCQASPSVRTTASLRFASQLPFRSILGSNRTMNLS